MRKERRKFNKDEAKQSIIELLDAGDCRCALAVTNEGIVYNGSGVDFLATLSMLADQAVTQMRIDAEDVRKAIEIGIDGAKIDGNDVNELKDEINKKMIEILDLMKEQIKK